MIEERKQSVLYEHTSFARIAKQYFMEAVILNLDLKCFVTFQEMENRWEVPQIPHLVTR